MAYVQSFIHSCINTDDKIRRDRQCTFMYLKEWKGISPCWLHGWESNRLFGRTCRWLSCWLQTWNVGWLICWLIGWKNTWLSGRLLCWELWWNCCRLFARLLWRYTCWNIGWLICWLYGWNICRLSRWLWCWSWCRIQWSLLLIEYGCRCCGWWCWWRRWCWWLR